MLCISSRPQCVMGITLDGNMMNNDVNPLRAGILLNNAERLTPSLWLQVSCRRQNISIPQSLDTH